MWIMNNVFRNEVKYWIHFTVIILLPFHKSYSLKITVIFGDYTEIEDDVCLKKFKVLHLDDIFNYNSV